MAYFSCFPAIRLIGIRGEKGISWHTATQNFRYVWNVPSKARKTFAALKFTQILPPVLRSFIHKYVRTEYATGPSSGLQTCGNRLWEETAGYNVHTEIPSICSLRFQKLTDSYQRLRGTRGSWQPYCHPWVDWPENVEIPRSHNLTVLQGPLCTGACSKLEAY